MLSLAAPPRAFSYQRPGHTERISFEADSAQPDAGSYSSVSADGRYIAFYTPASNLVPGDTNEAFDVFVRDRATGSVDRVSVASDGTQGNGPSVWPSISGDGRYVAFHSLASNLVAGDTNQTWDVFVHDRVTGVTERMSVASGGAEVFGISLSPSISADGRYVAFHSGAPDLVPGDPIEGSYDVFVHDRVTGATERISVGVGGVPPDADSYHPSVSADGRYVAFYSFAANLVPGADANGVNASDVYVRDRVAGTTERVSIASDGTQGNGESLWPSINADGRYVVYYSAASNLVPWDTNASYDVFLRDRMTGTTERVSVRSDAVEGDKSSSWPAISADGRYVAFQSVATNMFSGDTNTADDIFVRDRETGATDRVSVGVDGTVGNFYSDFPFMSADGRYVAFWSGASNLIPGDTNGIYDIFLRDRGRAVGIGELTAIPQGNQLSVSGWATFSGAVISTVTDPSGDGAAGAGPAGADLTGANLTYRPENGDLLVRLRLASLPTFAGGAGYPAVLYGMRFDFGGAHYEVRATTAQPTVPPSTKPYFALYRCDSTCTEQTLLSGGLGTTGAEVLFSLPLSALGAQEGASLTSIQAFTALGETATGGQTIFDQADLPNAVIPARQVSFGIVPKGTPLGSVLFDQTITLSEGNFLGQADLPAGAYDVWARACLGTTCGAAVSWPPTQLVRVVSRKVHGSAGTFDIDLPLTGTRGIECRSGGANGDYTLIFKFAQPLASVGGAGLTSGIGVVSSSGIDNSDTHQYIVNLTGVTNAQVITVGLTNVNDSAGNSSASGISASMGVLLADTTGNGIVSNTDVTSVKPQTAAPVTASNFRNDVNVNGIISNTDVGVSKAQVGTQLP